MWSLTGKAITVIGDDAATVIVAVTSESNAWGGTSSRQRILVTDLTIRSAVWSSTALVDIQSALGEVTLERVNLAESSLLSPPLLLRFTDCPNVHLRQITTTQVGRGVPNGATTARLQLVRSSTEVVGSTLYGIGRLVLNTCCTSEGGLGLHATGSPVTLIDSAVHGGSGTNCSPSQAISAGPGGAAAELIGSRLITLRGHFTGGNAGAGCPTSPAGGAGVVLRTGTDASMFGTACIGGNGGTPGPDTQVDSSSVLVKDPAAVPPLLFPFGVVRPTALVTTRLWAPPSTQATLLVGTEAFCMPMSPLGIGTLLVVPLAVMAPAIVPANGELTFQGSAPPMADQCLQLQYVVFDPTAQRYWLSNAALAFIRS